MATRTQWVERIFLFHRSVQLFGKAQWQHSLACLPSPHPHYNMYIFEHSNSAIYESIKAHLTSRMLWSTCFTAGERMPRMPEARTSPRLWSSLGGTSSTIAQTTPLLFSLSGQRSFLIGYTKLACNIACMHGAGAVQR